MSDPTIVGLCVFIFGSVIGSFLNVCIVRMPQGKSVVFPSSHCVHCRHPLPWFDNIPFLSYVLLRGRCRSCGQRISFRYFAVEALTASAFVVFYRHFGLGPVFFAHLVMLSGFIVATFVDFEHRIIPDEISINGMFAGVLLSLMIPSLHAGHAADLPMGRIIMWVLAGLCVLGTMFSEFVIKKNSFKKEDVDHSVLLFLVTCLLADGAIKWVTPGMTGGRAAVVARHLISLDASIIGLLVAGSIIYFMGLVGDLIFRKESMGGGDIKLMAMIGAFMGWKLAALTFFIAPFLGAVYGIAEKIRTKDSAIAYGPFIVAGALISLFYGEQIVHWIMNGYVISNIHT